MIEINNLRVLNDYLNQTIDVLVRAQRTGVGSLSPLGLSHTTFGAQPHFAGAPAWSASPSFGISPFGVSQYPYGAIGVDPREIALAHSPYAGVQGVPFAGALAGALGQQFPIAIDPFMAQRGLSHSPWAQAYSPLAEIARQQQLQQAFAAYRAWGLPV
jgi:hypothetical protein